MGNSQRFCSLIFVDGCFGAAPPTLPGWVRLLLHACRSSNQPKSFEMARESLTIEAMNRGYHVYKEIWCADVEEELSCVREVENYCDPFAVAVVRSINWSIHWSMATSPANHVCGGHENLHVGFYFADLILVVCQSTAKIGPIKFPAIWYYTEWRTMRSLAPSCTD